MHDDLSQALFQISEIRRTMARTQLFRGYRAATTAFTGLLAFAAAALQTTVAPDPVNQPRGYIELWTGVALAQCLHAYSPWAMALTFGVGQLLSAVVLYWNLERRHGSRRQTS